LSGVSSSCLIVSVAWVRADHSLSSAATGETLGRERLEFTIIPAGVLLSPCLPPRLLTVFRSGSLLTRSGGRRCATNGCSSSRRHRRPEPHLALAEGPLPGRGWRERRPRGWDSSSGPSLSVVSPTPYVPPGRCAGLDRRRRRPERAGVVSQPVSDTTPTRRSTVRHRPSRPVVGGGSVAWVSAGRPSACCVLAAVPGCRWLCGDVGTQAPACVGVVRERHAAELPSWSARTASKKTRKRTTDAPASLVFAAGPFRGLGG